MASGPSQFVAGLVQGMTGINHLAELDHCWYGGSSIYNDFSMAWTDMNDAHIVQTINEVGSIMSRLPKELSKCKNMDKEILAIEGWS